MHFFFDFLPEVEEKLKISLNNVFNLDLADLFFSFITAVQIFWILYSLGFIEPPKSSVKVLNTLCSVSCTWIFRIIYKIRILRTTIDITIFFYRKWFIRKIAIITFIVKNSIYFGIASQILVPMNHCALRDKLWSSY